MGFRHEVYQREKLIRNGLMVLEPVAIAGHIEDLAAVDETVKDGGGDSSVAKEVGPLVKALVGSDDEGGLFAHGGDEAWGLRPPLWGGWGGTKCPSIPLVSLPPDIKTLISSTTPFQI